jgi:cellobiose phosphorylase
VYGLVHASGILQFLTGERAWARINAASDINYGANTATLSLLEKKDEKRFKLVGINSLAADPSITKRFFGTGFARYEYDLNKQVECRRIISVPPSAAVHKGNPAIVTTISFKNRDSKKLNISFEEKIFMNYLPAALQEQSKVKRAVRYTNAMFTDEQQQTVICRVGYAENTFLTAHKKEDNNLYDAHPVSVYMHAQQKPGATITCKPATGGADALCAVISTVLMPGETKSFHIVLGLTYETDFPFIDQQVQELLINEANQQPTEGLYIKEWRKSLPDMSTEKNPVFKREMLWNAYTLEAMATYSSYFNETYVPQGTVYTYEDGENISNRDHSQALLPLCYTNPALAKSALRYVMKHTSYTGEIKRGNSGFGYIAPSVYQESDEQLYVFMALSEYLRITKDFDFLNETIRYYPVEHQQEAMVIDFLQQHFVYLRDEVGRGKHGLIKILNSDWSDSFFHKYSPNVYAQFAESILNTTMALAVLPQLVVQLQNAGSRVNDSFIKAIKEYHDELAAAFLTDFGNRDFAARCYLNHGVEDKLGMDAVCIEPQGYLLQMPEFTMERKQTIYKRVKVATYTPEKIGFRTREKSMWGGKPEGEDGGIWYSLTGPVIIGVSTFDKKEAWALMEQISFHNFSIQYPDYWVGQWTSTDNINSTLSTREGLYAYWQDTKKAIQGYCSHPHSWPLYCYYKLKEE